MGNSVGGSHDVNAFRGTVLAGRLPSPSSITFNGMFNEHNFQLSDPSPTTRLITPVADYAVVTNPKTKETEYWLGCFSKSRLDGIRDRKRAIRLVVVLDVSGSMSDTLTPPKTEEDLFKLKPKLEVAKGAILELIKNLKAGDQFGMVTFNESANVVQELSDVAAINAEDLKDKIEGMSPGGGTILASGMTEATRMLKQEITRSLRDDSFVVLDGESTSRVEPIENRIIFLTDMCDTSEDSAGPAKLLQISNENSKIGIHASFIGVGVDFNTDVTEKVTKVKGSNYFCILNEEEFKQKLSDEFAFNFFPLAFDVKLRVTMTDSDSFGVDKVYGTPFADELKVKEGSWSPSTHRLFPAEFKETVRGFLLATQRLQLPSLPPEILANIFNFISPPMEYLSNVNTSFPSAKDSISAKGGLILIKLQPKGKEFKEPVSLRVQMLFRDVSGTQNMEETEITIPPLPTTVGSHFSSKGISKGILLQQYVATIKTYLEAVHEAKANDDDAEAKKSEALEALKQVAENFNDETTKDSSLAKEAEILDRFISFQKSAPQAQGGCMIM